MHQVKRSFFWLDVPNKIGLYKVAIARSQRETVMGWSPIPLPPGKCPCIDNPDSSRLPFAIPVPVTCYCRKCIILRE